LTNAWILSSNAMKIDCGSQWRRYRGFSQRLETQLKGPTLRKKREMKVNTDVDFYTKTRNHCKTLWKTQKNYWKSKEYLIPKYKPSGGPVFTFIAYQVERFALLPPSVTPLTATFLYATYI